MSDLFEDFGPPLPRTAPPAACSEPAELPLWLTCLLLACFGLAMSACGVWGALAWGAAACH